MMDFPPHTYSGMAHEIKSLDSSTTVSHMDANGEVVITSVETSHGNDVAWVQVNGNTFPLKLPKGTTGDGFTHTSAISGNADVIAIGSYLLNGDKCGTVDVFKRYNNVWCWVCKLKSNWIDHGDCFGISVAINYSGSRIVVGAYRYDFIGSVFIFDRATDDTWVMSGRISEKPKVNSPGFGNSVDIDYSGGVIVVGSLMDKIVYVYRKIKDEWRRDFYNIRNIRLFNLYGSSVCISGNGSTLAIFECTLHDLSKNSIHIYKHLNGRWRKVGQLKNEDTGFFNGYLDIDYQGNTIVIGLGSQKEIDGEIAIFTYDDKCWIRNKINTGKKKPQYTSVCVSHDGNLIMAFFEEHLDGCDVVKKYHTTLIKGN